MGYSADLRMKAVKHRLEQSVSRADTAKVFGAGRSTVQSRVQRYEETGDLSGKPLNRKPGKIDPDALRLMSGNIRTRRNRKWRTRFIASNQAISKALKRLNITRKKNAPL